MDKLENARRLAKAAANKYNHPHVIVKSRNDYSYISFDGKFTGIEVIEPDKLDDNKGSKKLQPNKSKKVLSNSRDEQPEVTDKKEADTE